MRQAKAQVGPGFGLLPRWDMDMPGPERFGLETHFMALPLLLHPLKKIFDQQSQDPSHKRRRMPYARPLLRV
jgi:hypothetical protein